MRVAVCDDQPEAAAELKNMLLRSAAVKMVHIYSDIDIFWSALKENRYYDTVFMDIIWGGDKTGIDFAERLYQISPFIRLIYVTNCALEYVEEIFARPANLKGFLVKPVKQEPLSRILEKLNWEWMAGQEKILLYYQGGYVAVSHQEIIFLEGKLHKTRVVLTGRELLCSENLERLKERLGDRFLNCHKSYVVNMDYIQEFRGKEIVLSDGRSVPVSRARFKDAKEKFFRYISKIV